jgi:hypothetical protein
MIEKHTITAHSWLAWNTGGNEDDLSALQGLLQSRWCWVIAGNLVNVNVCHEQILRASYLALGVDVANVSSDTGCQPNIIQRKVGDTGVELEQKGERLANSTGGAQDGDLGVLHKFS